MYLWLSRSSGMERADRILFMHCALLSYDLASLRFLCFVMWLAQDCFASSFALTTPCFWNACLFVIPPGEPHLQCSVLLSILSSPHKAYNAYHAPNGNLRAYLYIMPLPQVPRFLSGKLFHLLSPGPKVYSTHVPNWAWHGSALWLSDGNSHQALHWLSCIPTCSLRILASSLCI